MSETQFVMVSEWMPNGNINEFVKAHRNANRFILVSFRFRNMPSWFLADDFVVPQLRDVARGLIYMHEQGMVHGDLKGVRFRVSGSPRL